MKILIFNLLVTTQISYAQITNQIIVKSTNFSKRHHSIKLPEQNSIIESKTISTELGLSHITFNNKLNLQALNKLIADNHWENAWFDELIEIRKKPNDPQYIEQWAIPFSKIDKVWDLTTGGNTYDGKEIVIAVLDDGFDVNHIDLSNVFWSNESEIPNNNIDDDSNGYIDDYLGLNIDKGNDDHPNLIHGTSVTGILAANGDNSQGIAGINWNIKIMPISNVDRVSEIIEAYDYVYKLRKAFNESNGGNGAFVAISSYSGGVPDRFGTEGIFKEWCDMYELMGSVGILSFGATDNRFVDVDQVGDMPSTCTSDYFIGVTGLEKQGRADKSTAYGKISVDIAAPSREVLTTNPDDAYGNFEDTSCATPMVSGVAALLFSFPCENLSHLITDKPSESALIIKRSIFDSVNKTDALNDLCSTGGFLDAFEAINRLNLLLNCGIEIQSERGALRITQLIQNGDQLTVFFISPNEDEHLLRWVDSGGKTILSKKIIPQRFGEKFAVINVPDALIGPTYLSITSKKHTASKTFFIRD